MTNVLDQQARNGSFTSGSVAVPLDADGQPTVNPDTGQPYGFVRFTGTVNQTDAADPTKTALGAITFNWSGSDYVAVNGLSEWAWQGGNLNTKVTPPAYRVPDLGIGLPTLTDADGNTVYDANGRPIYPRRVQVVFDTAGSLINFGVLLGVS